MSEDAKEERREWRSRMTDLTMDGITKDCPIECLASMLSTATYAALTAGLEDPATVGQVVDLYEQGKLVKIHNIRWGRIGEIRRCLAAAGVIKASIEQVSRPRETRRILAQDGHHTSCRWACSGMNRSE